MEQQFDIKKVKQDPTVGNSGFSKLPIVILNLMFSYLRKAGSTQHLLSIRRVDKLLYSYLISIETQLLTILLSCSNSSLD